MSDKQTLQSQITQLKSVLASPKTDGTTRKILENGLKKAEAKLEELEKAEKLESSKKELTPKQEAKVEEVKKETKSLAQTLKDKVKKAKEKIATTTPKATKKGGARSVAKAKDMAKQRRSTQKKQSLSDKDIESDANRFAINKTKRRSQGGRANQYGTKAENKGGVYYEKRENRYDVQNKRYAKLKKGGSLAEKYTFFGTSENGWYVKDKETNKFVRPMGKSVWDSKEEAIKDLKESKFKYEDGGAIQTINGTQFSTEDLSGMFARGGIMEHGLEIGDMIVGTSSDPYSIVVRNNGMEMVVDLNEGTRVSNNQGTRFSSRSMKDPMVVRTQFEEMDFEYADGGMMAKGGGVGDNVLRLEKGDVFEIIDIEHTGTNEKYVFLDYVDKRGKVMLETIPLNKILGGKFNSDDIIYVSEVSSDGVKLLSDEKLSLIVKSQIRSLLRKKNYADGGMMAKGGYSDFGYHVINDEVTLKNGKKVFITKGRYYFANELGDNKPSGVYYLTNNQDFIYVDEIKFPLNKMADGGSIQTINGTEFSTEDLSGMFEQGGRLKGSNSRTGESFGVVIGSHKKSDEYVKGGTEMNVRKSYGSRISEVKLVFDSKGNLNEIIDYGYSLDGYPNTSRGSGQRYYGDKKETLKVLSEKYNPSFAKKLIESVSTKMANGGVTNSMEDVNYLKGVSGLRATFIEEWANKNNVDLSKVANAIKTKKLKPIDLSTALSGRDGNKYAKDIIQKYSHNKMERGGKSYSKGDSIDSAKRVASAMRSKMMKKKS